MTSTTDTRPVPTLEQIHTRARLAVLCDKLVSKLMALPEFADWSRLVWPGGPSLSELNLGGTGAENEGLVRGMLQDLEATP